MRRALDERRRDGDRRRRPRRRRRGDRAGGARPRGAAPAAGRQRDRRRSSTPTSAARRSAREAAGAPRRPSPAATPTSSSTWRQAAAARARRRRAAARSADRRRGRRWRSTTTPPRCVLVLAALAAGRDVLVSRGAAGRDRRRLPHPRHPGASGARLVEVGTTNRTSAADYERAIGPDTALLLRVAPLQLPHRRLHRGGAVRPPLAELGRRARPAAARRPRVGPARARSGVRRRARRARLDRGRRDAGLLLRRQAAGRAAERASSPARARPSSASAGTRWRAPCASASCRWPRSRRRCGCTATRRWRGPRSPCCAWRTSPPPRCGPRAERLAAAVGGEVGRHRGARRRRCAAAARAAVQRRLALPDPAARCRPRCATGVPPVIGRVEEAGCCSTPARSPTTTSPSCAAAVLARLAHDADTLGTAGHIDHGKTALVRALTGIDTDRLAEENERGISIELGYAPLDLGDGRRALGRRRARPRALRPHHGRRRHRHRPGAALRRLRRRRHAADARAPRDPRPARRRATASSRSPSATSSTTRAPRWRGRTPRRRWPAGGSRRRVIEVSARTGPASTSCARRCGEAALATRVARSRRAAPGCRSTASFSLRGIGTVVTGTLWSGDRAPATA